MKNVVLLPFIISFTILLVNCKKNDSLIQNNMPNKYFKENNKSSNNNLETNWEGLYYYNPYKSVDLIGITI